MNVQVVRQKQWIVRILLQSLLHKFDGVFETPGIALGKSPIVQRGTAIFSGVLIGGIELLRRIKHHDCSGKLPSFQQRHATVVVDLPDQLKIAKVSRFL